MDALQHPEHPLPLTGPSLRDVAVDALELGRNRAIVKFALRHSQALDRLMRRIEAERVAARLEGLPRRDVQQLAAAGAGRSTRTVRRRWATEAEQDD